MLSKDPINYHTCKNSCRPSLSRVVSARSTGNNNSTVYRYCSFESRNPQSTATSHNTGSVYSTGRDIGFTPVDMYIVSSGNYNCFIIIVIVGPHSELLGRFHESGFTELAEEFRMCWPALLFVLDIVLALSGAKSGGHLPGKSCPLDFPLGFLLVLC